MHSALSCFLVLQGTDSLSTLPLSPSPPCRNSEKLEGPAGSPPLPRARNSWMEQLGRRDLGVWNMVI